MRLLTLTALFISSFAFSIEWSLQGAGSLEFDEALVELEPAGQFDGQLFFWMYVNTHSLSFEGYDLKELTTLYMNNQEFKPVTVPELFGHHNEGELIFNTPDPISTDVKIVIRDFAGEPVREFFWAYP